MAKKNNRQLSLLPFIGNTYTVYVVKNHWGPVWHVQDKNGHTVRHQPGSFASQQSAAAWAVEQGYQVRLDTEGMSHLSKLVSGQ